MFSDRATKKRSANSRLQRRRYAAAATGTSDERGSKRQLIQNIIGAMKTVPREIQERQIAYFTKADCAYGEGVAKGLGLAAPKAA
jgi:catalase